jgi:hypothetical protein
MQRRTVVAALTALPLLARAHHGWSSFDTSRPIYLEGRAVRVAWRNPHAELDLELPADLKLPPSLTQRALPAQSAQVDGAALLAAASVPARKERTWHVELAPLTRMQAWKVAEIKPGAVISVLGFGLADAQAEALLRAEYLFVGDQAYGLRSSPA